MVRKCAMRSGSSPSIMDFKAILTLALDDDDADDDTVLTIRVFVLPPLLLLTGVASTTTSVSCSFGLLAVVLSGVLLLFGCSTTGCCSLVDGGTAAAL